MEKKRWSLIFIGLCLALVFSVSSVEAQEPICFQGDFCDRDHDGFFRDHKRCRDCGIIDCNDDHPDPPELGGPPCDGGEEDTKTSKKSIDLILTFDDKVGDNVESDWRKTGSSPFPFVDNDGVGVSAGGRSQPNPAAGIHMGLRAKPRVDRQLDLNIMCEGIDFDGDGEDLNNCNQLPTDFGGGDFGVGGLFPNCDVGNGFCDLGLAVRPYKVKCPETLPSGECPDVFTMDPNTPELMSFRLFFGGRFTFEVASAIGADGSQDPGTCLSLLTEDQLDDFLDFDTGTCGDVHNCNVSVTASDLDGDKENDAWRVVADGVTALICDRPGVTVIGKATLTFGFDAIKK